jgi:hypothetical protein
MVNNVEIYSIPTGTVWYNLKQTGRWCFVVEFSLTWSFFYWQEKALAFWYQHDSMQILCITNSDINN